MGYIITLTGDSGTGKSLLANSLSSQGYKFVISTTTRSPRPLDNKGELEYISIDEFQRMRDCFVKVFNPFGSDFYGTRKEYLNQALISEDNYMMILVPDAVSAIMDYKNIHFPQATIIPFFFTTLPYEEAVRRMRERRDAIESIERRLKDMGRWEEDARKSRIPYRFLNSMQSAEKTVTQVLDYLESYGFLMSPKPNKHFF